MASIDLTNLREMTGGDVELEKELFAEFCSSFEQGIRSLQESNETDNAEEWQSKAHALKGIAFNLGAQTLGTLCRQAQDGHLAVKEVRQGILKDIQSEYERVKPLLLEK
jgi:HPt (histidine-containing phosphotransfer) domain-containing protein